VSLSVCTGKEGRREGLDAEVGRRVAYAPLTGSICLLIRGRRRDPEINA